MEFPDLYRKVAVVPKRDFNIALEEFSSNNRWKENASIIDIGSGDGSTTKEILLKHVPPSYEKLVGCDLSASMVKYANEHFASQKIEFLMFDITQELPLRLKNAFDHAFSSYVFHRIEEQRAAFLNTYEMLRDGGNCLLVFLGYYPMIEHFRILSRKKKWAEDLKGAETFSPYHNSQNPSKDVSMLMESVGFKDVEVKVFEKTNTYSDVTSFKGLIKAINPFKVVNKRWEEFMVDYFDLVPIPNALKIDYQLIVAYGSK